MNEHEGECPDAADTSYERFLLTEYNNIAQAHFNTVNMISTFFKHYLLIVSVPIPIFALIYRDWGGGKGAQFLETFGLGIPIAGVLVALVGLCVMVYMANLRFDTLLYARTVNGIRRYFSGLSGLPFDEELRTRVLPRTIYQPRYFELRFFLPVEGVRFLEVFW